MAKGIAYCGINCDECINGDGKSYALAEGLLQNMNKCCLDQWQEQVPRDEEFDYPSLKKGLKWIAKNMKCDGCKAGDGDPECKIRKCAVEKDVENCGACAELPCTIIEEWKAQGIDIEKNFK
jgi:hypothetical protein